MLDSMFSFIKFIQSFASPVLDGILTVFNMLSQQYFLVGLVAFVYWIIDKKRGETLAASLIFSICLACGIKGIFKFPRPFKYKDKGIRLLNHGTAPGFSFPSADSAAAASVASSFSTWTKKRLIWILLAGYTLLIGFCRMYFGLHFPTDVLTGFIVGAVVAFTMYLYRKKFENSDLIYFIFILLLLLFIFFPGQQKDYYTSLGLSLGAVCGIIIEHRFVNFTCNVTKNKKILRFSVGIAGIIIIALLGSLLTPDYPFFFVLDKFALTFFATGIYPMIFKKLNF